MAGGGASSWSSSAGRWEHASKVTRVALRAAVEGGRGLQFVLGVLDSGPTPEGSSGRD